MDDASFAAEPAASHPFTGALATLDIDGGAVHLIDGQVAGVAIADAASHHTLRPLGVASINLDHVHYFGRSQRAARHEPPFVESGQVEWLNLIDGAPIARQIRRLTGHTYPKLSGSDLVTAILDQAALCHQSVAILGGVPDATGALRLRFAAQWPSVRFAGHWTPERAALTSPEESAALAAEIRAANVDILIVCLGKPRQEAWIDEYGALTGVGALLAFGAVVDFLSGRVVRAPEWISQVGLEWAWRLALEPRRLARRYLVQGPPAYLAVRRSKGRCA